MGLIPVALKQPHFYLYAVTMCVFLGLAFIRGESVIGVSEALVFVLAWSFIAVDLVSRRLPVVAPTVAALAGLGALLVHNVDSDRKWLKTAGAIALTLVCIGASVFGVMNLSDTPYIDPVAYRPPALGLSGAYVTTVLVLGLIATYFVAWLYSSAVGGASAMRVLALVCVACMALAAAYMMPHVEPDGVERSQRHVYMTILAGLPGVVAAIWAGHTSENPFSKKEDEGGGAAGAADEAAAPAEEEEKAPERCTVSACIDPPRLVKLTAENCSNHVTSLDIARSTPAAQRNSKLKYCVAYHMQDGDDGCASSAACGGGASGVVRRESIADAVARMKEDNSRVKEIEAMTDEDIIRIGSRTRSIQRA